MRRTAFAPAVALLGVVLAASGCARSPIRPPLPPGSTEPIVKGRMLVPIRGALARVAFAGCDPAPGLQPFSTPTSPSAAEAAARTGEILREVLAAEGIALVPAEETRRVLAEAAASRPQELAVRVAEALDATSLLVARLDRWNDRDGRPGSVKAPASVAFEVDLYSPRGQRLWTATFSETQHSSDQRPTRALRYPGRGTRWLTARELARWGAGHLVRSLREAAPRGRAALPVPGHVH